MWPEFKAKQIDANGKIVAHRKMGPLLNLIRKLKIGLERFHISGKVFAFVAGLAALTETMQQKQTGNSEINWAVVQHIILKEMQIEPEVSTLKKGTYLVEGFCSTGCSKRIINLQKTRSSESGVFTENGLFFHAKHSVKLYD